MLIASYWSIKMKYLIPKVSLSLSLSLQYLCYAGQARQDWESAELGIRDPKSSVGKAVSLEMFP